MPETIRDQARNLVRSHLARAEKARNLFIYDWHLRQAAIWTGVMRSHA